MWEHDTEVRSLTEQLDICTIYYEALISFRCVTGNIYPLFSSVYAPDLGPVTVLVFTARKHERCGQSAGVGVHWPC